MVGVGVGVGDGDGDEDERGARYLYLSSKGARNLERVSLRVPVRERDGGRREDEDEKASVQVDG